MVAIGIQRVCRQPDVEGLQNTEGMPTVRCCGTAEEHRGHANSQMWWTAEEFRGHADSQMWWGCRRTQRACRQPDVVGLQKNPQLHPGISLQHTGMAWLTVTDLLVWAVRKETILSSSAQNLAQRGEKTVPAPGVRSPECYCHLAPSRLEASLMPL